MMYDHPGGFAVYYYVDYKGMACGSVNSYKAWMMSKKFGKGKIDICGIAEFKGRLMSKDYI